MYINYVKVYQKGKSNESFYSAVPGDLEGSGVENPTASRQDDDTVTVFNLGGLQVARVKAADWKTALNLPAGIYVVKHGDATEKLIVR